jgi:hypothetical protein
LSFNYYLASEDEFQLFHYYSGRVAGRPDGRAGGRVAGLNENKANSASQLKLQLGLG